MHSEISNQIADGGGVKDGGGSGPISCVKSSASALLRKGSTQISLDTNLFPASIAANKKGSNNVGGGGGTPTERVKAASALENAGNTSVASNYEPFKPDYTIKAVSDVLYAKITRSTYLVRYCGKKIHSMGVLGFSQLF